MKSSDFVVWMFDAHFPHACSLDDLEGFEEVFQLWKGREHARTFPSDASFTMRADRSANTVLTDSLHNTDNLKVISQRFKDFLGAREVQQLEYLKVLVRNHKKKLVPTNYYIVNPLVLVDCLDRIGSKAKASPANKDRVMSLSKLVLKASALPSDRDLFRVAGLPAVHLVRRELADAITKEQFTGIRWLEVSKFPEK